MTDFDAEDTIVAWADTSLRPRYGARVRTGSTQVWPHSFALVLDPDYASADTVGGYSQPYDFPDRLLIVRPGNTTIGNGLAETDPVMLYSPSGDTSTFGTPFDTGDSIPDAAGNGISWERVSPRGARRGIELVPLFGPGWLLSGQGEQHLVSEELVLPRGPLCWPLSFQPGVAETIRVRVANTGRVAVSAWTVRVFRDLNANLRQDGGESLGFFVGSELARGEEDTLTCIWSNPEHGIYDLLARVICPGDQDSSDDIQSARLELLPPARHFCLQSDQFGPGLSGYPESLGIAYSLPDSKGNLRVTVFDLNARERAMVHDGRPEAKDGMLYWGGSDRYGRSLSVGIYVVVCEHKSGKDVIFEKKPVVFAKGR